MPKPSAVETPALTSLSEYLQRLTETLAATTHQDGVLAAALNPAVTALGAVAGTALLLDATGKQLQVAATECRDAQIVWQDGPLSPDSPAGEALNTRQPLYFEHAGTLKTIHPHLEEQTGGAASVATAVLPMFLEGQPLGVLILDFKGPHIFTLEEQRFLLTLASQTTLALSRAQLIAQREAETAELRSSAARFRALVEVSPVGMAVGSLDGQLTLVNDAYLKLLGYTRAEYEEGEIDWQALTPEAYRAQDQRAFEAAFSGGVSTTYEKAMLTRQGEVLPLEVTLIRHDATQVVGYLKDLRAQKAQERVVAGQAISLLAEQEASQAFMAFTEAASHTTDVDELARLVLPVLQKLLPGSSVGFYELKEKRWYPKQLTTDVTPELRQYLQNGLPLETPALAEMTRTRAPVFVDHWGTQQHDVEHASQYGVVSLYPILQDGAIEAALTVGLQDQHSWTDRERGMVLAVGRSFSLLYERISAAQAVQAQRAEAEGRGRVLELLASLTTEMTSQQEQGSLTLIQHAQKQVLELLQLDHAAYWEPEGDSWRLRTYTNDVGNPELMAMMHAGFPVGGIPTLDQPWTTSEPLYQDSYQDGTDVEAGVATHVSAVAVLPIGREAHRRGVINFTSFRPHQWSSLERVLLETLAQGIWLALERLESAELLQRQQQEAERRSRALEAFAVLSRDLAEETDRYILIRRAQETMLSLLTAGYAVYWEQTRTNWALKAQVGDMGNPALQRLIDEEGLPLNAPSLASTWESGAPNYQDQYDQGADTPTDIIRHVNAAAVFRVHVHGQPIGMLGIGLFEQRSWTPMDKAALETSIHGLGLLLERAQSVSAMKQSNQDLQAANAELEAFTYSASHDLRTPVRHVMAFAELAEKALEKTPNERVQHHLSVVKQAATRMTDLIDGMLVLSRSGRQELKLQPVDLNTLVTQARRDAATEFGTRPVHWQIGELPTVQGDAHLLQQVMTNLLSNAVKYSAKREVSEVRVWAQEAPSEWCVSVQDNGIGFAPGYAHKLFGIFQRLHSEREFKGTGVGLATVKRIVQKHGGRVFAESDGQYGATFGFTLLK